MAAANNEFFEALSMLEHERGITAEYLIDKIKAAIVIAVKKNYEVEDNNVMVEIDPANGANSTLPSFRMLWPMRTGTTSTARSALPRPRTSARITRWATAWSLPSRPRTLAASPHRPQSTSSVRASARPSAASSCSEMQSRAHEHRARPPSPAWTPNRASWPWIWARAARPSCPATSRCPVRHYTEGQRAAGLRCGRASAASAVARVMISRTHPGPGQAPV